MTAIQSVTYVPNPKEPTPDEWCIFGLYRVRYDDGFNVALPHTGWTGTISQAPLDLNNPEHCAVIERRADEIRATQGGRA